MDKLTGYFSKDEICDQHASTQGYESCCTCKNDDLNDKRMCLQAKEKKKYSKNGSFYNQ
ncbi:MAG: hypothetical protein WC577_02365 [Candidatus Paceibacterota bacterium]